MIFVNGKLKRRRKEAVVTCFKTLAKYLRRGTEENRVNFSCDSRPPGKGLNPIQYLSNTKEC
jgi:hypothetical protein